MTKEDIIGALARGYCSKENQNKVLDPYLIQAMAIEVEKLLTQKDTEKASWLRSEIEKLEGEEMRVKKVGFENPETKMQQIKQRVYAQGHNQALTSIITRYKEELKVLESKFDDWNEDMERNEELMNDNTEELLELDRKEQ